MFLKNIQLLKQNNSKSAISFKVSEFEAWYDVNAKIKMVSKAVAGTVCLWIWSVIFQHSNQIQTSQVLRLILKKACRTFKIKYRPLYNWLHFQIRFCFSFFSLLSYISQNIHEDSLVNGINQSNNPFIPKSPCSIMWKVRPWHCFCM